jgi:hypothetical protein
VGDSTAAATGLGLQQWARETGAAAVDVVSGPGCAFEQSGVAVIRDGWERSAPPACLELLASARTVAARHPPDAVIVLIGSIQLADWRVGAAPVQAIGDPGFDARYSGTASSALSTLESLGAPVLWATLPVPAWEPSKQFTGYEPPGSGPLTINDAGRTARLNHLNRNLVGAHPLVRLFPYADLLIGPGGQVSNDLRPDGMHLDPDLVPELMQDRMEEALRAAYRDVVRARPEIALPGSPWSS